MSAARPSKYRPEFVVQVAKLASLGAAEAEIADFFQVDRATIWRWKGDHPEFCNALKGGKAVADDRVENALYEKALGYSVPAVKHVVIDGDVRAIRYSKHFPPDTTAIIFWLKNRKPDQWRSKNDPSACDEDIQLLNRPEGL